MHAGSTAVLLTDDEGRALLEIARESLTERLNAGLRKNGAPRAFVGKLAEPRGVFVTLTKRGDLRGCTGYVEPIKPLGDAVADLAISSALHDSRFEPLDGGELPDVHIE